jgi:hypothetical protein
MFVPIKTWQVEGDLWQGHVFVVELATNLPLLWPFPSEGLSQTL